MDNFNSFILISRWYHLLIISLIGLLVYIGILYSVKEFNKEDYIFIKNTLNLKKMIIYIRDELKK